MITFRFIDDSVTINSIKLDSYVIITANFIHVFDEKRNEIVRISGLHIITASVMDSTYVYIMEEHTDQVFVQKADPDEDYELSYPTEVTSMFA